jgi:hydroxypyruvate reductase
MKWRRQTYSHEKVAIKRHKRLKTDLESGPDFFFFLSLLCLFMAMNELHRYARSIFDHALSAVDPRQAVKNIELDLPSGPVYSIAIGKAAASMARGLEDKLGDKLTAPVLIAAGGHPLPDENSLASAQAAFALLDRANAEQATVVFLISGGGSAMIEWPVSDEISLVDLQAANKTLISCGAHIAEVNAVRRAFSAVKGGALARRARRAKTFTLIVSDTNRGDEANVASGPTLNPPADAPKAIDVVAHYQLETVLPPSIMKAVSSADNAAPPVNGSHLVILDNETAIKAAWLKAHGLVTMNQVATDICEQEIQQGCDLLLARLMTSPQDATSCLVSGGEFSCPVHGDGRGGRNLETALRCAIALAKEHSQGPHLVVLSAGTDGIDGNSPAAGAIADETTVERARNLGLDAADYLARSDSYTFFERLDDLIITGPTGTNVRDLRILLRAP